MPLNKVLCDIGSVLVDTEDTAVQERTHIVAVMAVCGMTITNFTKCAVPNYFIILSESDIDKIIIAELFKSMCRELNNHQQDDLLYDVGERIKVKAYHIEDINW